MPIVDEQEVGQALRRLALTDAEAAQLKRAVEAHHYIARKKRYYAQLQSTHKTVDDRKADSEQSKEYAEEMEKYFDAVQESEALQNERKTLQLKIDVWRSLNANRRQGG
jgi:actin-related protein